MRRATLGLALVLLTVTGALAEDAPRRPPRERPAPPEARHTWTGPYMGVHGGLARGGAPDHRAPAEARPSWAAPLRDFPRP